MLTVTFRSLGPSRRESVVGFDLGSPERNADMILRHAYTHNSEIVSTHDSAESLSYGVRCPDCGEYETACRCEG